MIKTLLLYLTFINFSLIAHASDRLNSFRTDYCTGYPEGTLNSPSIWKHCCLTHDLFFWAGGTKADRDQADLNLKSCVEETGHPQQAKIIYLAVRIGSRSPVKLPERKWNNGWPSRPDEQALTEADIDRIEVKLNHSRYNYIQPSIKEFLLQELRSR